mmetsp:Transcript_80209/g.141567  ORF Transcript_80209/g.141567 Transcript_80209/m.141567 type:complete len:230 (+) Transcript_80209:89-778(+)
MSLKLLCSAAFLYCGSATILGDMDNGAKFDKCIAIEDWEGKTLSDDITLQDRDENGCCPAGTVPGVKHYNNYVGAQVACGFKEDGTIATSTSTSNGVTTCTYNQCYIWKQDLACEDGRQLLNGCCAAATDCTTNTCGFEEGCMNYAYTFDDVDGTDVSYCLTYNKDYQMENTADKTDDQSDDKLQTDKVYVYTPCSGGGSGDSSTTSGAKMLGGVVCSLMIVLAAFLQA